MLTIAIDCGASFVKGALFSEEGSVLIKLQEPAPSVCQNGEIRNPAQITELLSVVEGTLSKLSDGGGASDYRLCVSNEMHGFLLADSKGTPLTDYISWQKEYLFLYPGRLYSEKAVWKRAFVPSHKCGGNRII